MGDMLRSIIQMERPFNMVVLVVLIVMITTVIKAMAKYIRQYACHRQELEFKRELLDRGMSAADIEQVIRARGPATKADE